MKKILILAFMGLGLFSCVDESVFEKSNRNKASSIYVVNPINPSTTIQGNIQLGEGTDDNPDQAFVSLPPSSELDNITIQNIVVPSLASVEPDYTTVRDFNNVQTFWVVAENGKDRRRLDVVMTVGEYERQVKYASLIDYWVPIGQFNDGNSYYSVGEPGQYSPWANTNVVAAVLNKATCIPSGFPNPTGHVRLTTLYNQIAGGTVGSGIAAATLFLGEFRANGANFLPRDNQRKNADHGIPFVYKPKAIRFEYRYTPGTQVVEWVSGSGVVKWVARDLNETDSMEVWAVLQKRVYDQENPANTKFYRIGSAGFISSEKSEGWATKEIAFYYGREQIENSIQEDPQAFRVAGINLPWAPLWVFHFYTDPNTGVNGPPVKESGTSNNWKYTTQLVKEQWGNASEDPTHLSFNFSASAGGYRYKGAGSNPAKGHEGSTLEVRNVEFVY